MHGIYQSKTPRDDLEERWQAEDGHFEVALKLELIESQMCWYELLLNPFDWEKRKEAIDQLRHLQAQANELSFANTAGQMQVCFFCAREKVRFSLSRQPKFTLLSGAFQFYVEVGARRQVHRFSTTFVDAVTGHKVKPEIELSATFITITLPDEDPEKVSVYEFLKRCGFELGSATDIYAVSVSDDPLKLWLNAADRRLTQMLYNVSNEAHDFFFYSNLFRCTWSKLGVNTRLASLTGEEVWQLHETPSVELVGEYHHSHVEANQPLQNLLVERTFEAYFKLHETLPLLKQTNIELGNVGYAVQVLMEMESPHELYRFGSLEREASDQHMFACRFNGAEMALDVLA